VVCATLAADAGCCCVVLRTAARACAAHGLSPARKYRSPALGLSPQCSAWATEPRVLPRSVLDACECSSVWGSEEVGHPPRSRRALAGRPEVARTPRPPDGRPRDERPTPLECESIDRARSLLLRVRGLSGPRDSLTVYAKAPRAASPTICTHHKAPANLARPRGRPSSQGSRAAALRVPLSLLYRRGESRRRPRAQDSVSQCMKRASAHAL